MTYYHSHIASPVGKLTLVASDIHLAAILWHDNDYSATFMAGSTENINHPLLLETKDQLTEYFDKQRIAFTLPLDFSGGTPFQVKVWEALLTIPFGETRTYGQVAKQIGNPKSVRAVGAAANRNPIPIIAPCHRVIGASGELVGFGGGIANKSLLLKLEHSRKNPTLW
ncbi:methylated-DNA--[protein]-cysteine S-methyltransferase [Hufsiella ginkgonis]|uniref:Methylated-DNA--protein-cysteine methyltransferase n=1 Tax=Hufsiella ginkgonis TaxID=2695274 RepID=A0A7K1XX99_9SPHI|nr:methylated-DNA--[protein]-cysteine S-methyltransferase [Hufsiella ginkgonis]MXV15635.1 methylated-DNA--[protein]-cysteine S-methyltransferase [Hufsiella ginkgonis]